MTILPTQSGEIRLTANLLDTRRRFAPPTKGAGSGRLGGHREKDGGRRNGYGEAGEIRLAANLWIRGAGGAVASEDWRGAKGLRRDGMRTDKRKEVAGRRNL